MFQTSLDIGGGIPEKIQYKNNSDLFSNEDLIDVVKAIFNRRNVIEVIMKIIENKNITKKQDNHLEMKPFPMGKGRN